MDFEDPPQYAETLPEMLNATHLRDDDGGAERLIVGLVSSCPALCMSYSTAHPLTS